MPIRIAPYQAVIESKDSLYCSPQQCGQMCMQSGGLEFQVVSDKVIADAEDFTTNPTNRVFDGDVIQIDTSVVPNIKGANADVLMLYSDTKCYVYYFDTVTGAGQYQITDLANDLCLINIEVAGGANGNRNRLRNAINGTFGAETGATAANSGQSVIISNLPSNTHFDYFFSNYLLLQPITFDAADDFINNMYWSADNQSMCFFNVSDIIAVPTGTPSYFWNDLEFIATENKRFIFSFDVYNSLDEDINVNPIIKDNGNFLFPSATFNEVVLAGETKTVTFEWIQPTGTPLTFFGQIEILISSLGVGLDNYITGFCIDDFKLDCFDYATDIQAEDCLGNTITIPFTIDNYENNQLINLDTSTLLGEHIFTITDNDGNTIDTFPIDFKDIENLDSCYRDKLIKLDFTSSCKVGDIDYANLPFYNEIYLNGYIAKRAAARKESIGLTTSIGQDISIYRHTIGRYTMGIHPYNEAIMCQIERYFEHETILVNDEEYYLSDNDLFSVSEISYGTYSGEVSLNKKGSEVIVSNCCC